jgi:lambda family phage portal protein
MGLLNTLAGVFGYGPADTAIPTQQALAGGTTSFDAGSWNTRELEGWWPSLLSADDEALDARDTLVARARDLYRNHPVIHGAVNKIVDAVIGSRVLLSAQPMHELLGMDITKALDWSLTTQAEFKVWAYGPGHEADVAAEASFGQLMRTAKISRLVDGECLAVIRNKGRGKRRYTTCIELIDTDRLTNPNGVADNMKLANGNTIYGGIEYAPDGEPVAYHIRVKHPMQLNTQGDNFKWVRIARFTSTGKPQVIHSFRKHRPNQRRGISALAPIIKRVRMNDNYDIAELEAALFDAINAGFVESPYPTADVAAAMAPSGQPNTSGWSLEKQLAYRAENKVNLTGVRMIHGFPGEKFNWKQPARPAANYPAFKGAGQHDMAAGLGLSYPQLSEDWADINYSSGRTLLNEKYRGFDSMGEEFCDQVCSPIYAAWLEEAVAVGTIKAPKGAARFYDNRALIAFASWLRPGRGKIDPLKEENASDIAVNARRSNNAIECANNGLDLYDVMMGAAREDLIREKLGQPKFVPLKIAGAAGATEGEGSDGSPGSEDDRDADGQPNEEQQQQQRQRRRQNEGAQ